MKIFFYSLREFDELKYYEKFVKQFNVEAQYTTEYPTLNNVEYAKGYDAICIITNPLDAELIDRFKSIGIKYICTRTIGYEHIDIAHCKKIGIKVTHVTYKPDAVANHTLMVMLMATRHILTTIDCAKKHDFTLQGKIGKELGTCTVGVIGTGRIGEAVIDRLSVLGCKVLAYDIIQKDSVKSKAKYVDLDTLYKESDVITLHCPSFDSNYHMINKDSISKMKDGVYLINTARGKLVNTYDLIEACKSKKIACAAIDAFEEEYGYCYVNFSTSNINTKELDLLCSTENIILSPHTAFYTELSISDMFENAISSLLDLEQKGTSIFEI